eukprot:1517709-Amphidinium_carterae.3
MWRSECCLMGPFAKPRKTMPMRTSSKSFACATASSPETVRSKSSSRDCKSPSARLNESKSNQGCMPRSRGGFVEAA